MNLNMQIVEDAAKELYIRALKQLPPDIKTGFNRLAESETDTTASTILGTMMVNIEVAEKTNNLLCQDTGLPIYNIYIGPGLQFDGVKLKQAIRLGCERATKEHPLRSSVVHPITRVNNHTGTGERIPVINVDFIDRSEELRMEMVPKGSGSENGSFLRMCVPAEGVNAVKTFVIDQVIEAGG